MIRRILIVVLSLATVGFILLTGERMRMDYNENGIYFDGTTTFNSDAIVGYSFVTLIFLVITVGLIAVTRKRPTPMK